MVTHEIIEQLAVLSSTKRGTKQLNLIRWNDGAPVYDLRRLDNDGQPLRGCTITEEEAAEVVRVLSKHLQNRGRC